MNVNRPTGAKGSLSFRRCETGRLGLATIDADAATVGQVNGGWPSASFYMAPMDCWLADNRHHQQPYVQAQAVCQSASGINNNLRVPPAAALQKRAQIGSR